MADGGCAYSPAEQSRYFLCLGLLDYRLQAAEANLAFNWGALTAYQCNQLLACPDSILKLLFYRELSSFFASHAPNSPAFGVCLRGILQSHNVLARAVCVYVCVDLPSERQSWTPLSQSGIGGGKRNALMQPSSASQSNAAVALRLHDYVRIVAKAFCQNWSFS
eukprot:1160634-Pelagomonas_calceolata.AAC.7